MTPAPSAELRYNTVEEIQSIHQELRNSFNTGKTIDVGLRKHQLKQLSFLLNDNVEAIAEAITKDLGRCRFESVFAEIMLTTNSVLEAHDNVDKWAADEKQWAGPVWALHRPTIRKEPKGTVLVIGAWNYPISVQIGPMVGALASGCTFVLKPSEVAAHSAKLITELWDKYMDPTISRIVNGGIRENTALLDLQWEHIMYTGNGTVGRIVAEKAAKWLCPTTLELGGKSPVIIDKSANLNIAAHRMLWAKSVNCGQTCIAPDYVLCTTDVQADLIKELKKAEKEFWPQGVVKSPDYGRIINERQWSRLSDMLEESNGRIVIGGEKDEKERFFAPTIIADCPKDDSAMAGEIFGPILPIITVQDTDEAIRFINTNDRPLALYVFANSNVTKKVFDEARSGGVVAGDLMLHYVSAPA
jgi:aldehyde dehydrogenase (NAD+)